VINCVQTQPHFQSARKRTFYSPCKQIFRAITRSAVQNQQQRRNVTKSHKLLYLWQ